MLAKDESLDGRGMEGDLAQADWTIDDALGCDGGGVGDVGEAKAEV
ncbi:hypothetical protein BNJ_00011 [Kaumoebavirus]|nr:hypothetical protein BNJ_00011 [Kaumoebavirus]ARA71857.1 hypothetical protein BNJ_00011 [Kaumoebavirus]